MISQFRKGDALFKKQTIALLIAAFIPWLIHLLGLMGIIGRLGAHHRIDFTPFTFIFTSLLIGWSLLRYELFDIIPIAREKIIEDLRDGILVLDTQHRIIDLNAEMKKLISTPSNVIGMSLAEALPFPNHLDQLILKKVNGKVEFQISKNNEVHFIEVKIIPLFNKEKDYRGVILLFKNITERKKAALQLEAQAKELKSLNQLKDRLFSIISHDLRTPLINLFEVLNTHRIGLLNEQELNTLLLVLSKDISYTSSLIENLLHWSKNQLHGEQINPLYFDFKTICEREVSYFKTKAVEKGIIIEDQVHGSTMVFADVQMIQLVMRNLISNAIKFCITGNSIKIFSKINKANEIMISIEDSGVGIRETELKKLFTLEFFTTRGTGNEQGTGLGLLLCKEFVEKNNGSIGVESTSGKGSRFYFTLPLNPLNNLIST